MIPRAFGHRPAAGVEHGDDRVTTLGSLRIRNYRLFMIGQTTSVVGSWMQNIAIAWQTLELSHSGAVLGAVTAARFAPLLIFGAWGGLVTDRSDNKRLFTITQMYLTVISFVLAVMAWSGHLGLAALVVIVIALGVVNVFDNPARQNLIVQLVDRRYLTNAIALNSVLMNAARIIGPGLGGAVIATLGTTPCFFINAFSFVAVMVSLFAMRRSEMPFAERATRGKGQVVEGLRYVARTPQLLRPMIMVLVIGLFTWEFPVTLPLITTVTFHEGSSQYGIAMACMGVGSVCGGLLAARRTRLTVRSLANSAVLWGISVLASALATSMTMEYCLMFLVGSGAITFNAAAKTLLQLASEPQMRGRVMALWLIAWQGATAIGGPIVGGVAALFGPRYAVILGGVGAIAVGAVMLEPRVRRSARNDPALPVPRDTQARAKAVTAPDPFGDS